MTDAAPTAPTMRPRLPVAGREIVLVGALVLVGAVFAGLSPYFLTAGNLVTMPAA